MPLFALVLAGEHPPPGGLLTPGAGWSGRADARTGAQAELGVAGRGLGACDADRLYLRLHLLARRSGLGLRGGRGDRADDLAVEPQDLHAQLARAARRLDRGE